MTHSFIKPVSRVSRAVLFCLVILAISTGISAQQEEEGSDGLASDSLEQLVELSREVDRDEVTVGDRLRFTIVVAHHPEVEVTLPDVGDELGQFIVRDFDETIREVREDGWVVEYSRYWVSTYFTGDHEIPPVSVSVRDRAGRTAVVRSSPLAIHVASVLTGEDEGLKDLRRPATIPSDPLVLLMILLGSLAVMALLAGVWLFIRARLLRRALVTDRTAQLSPHELAIRELARLTASGLLKENRFKEFHVAIAEIVRTYLGGTFRFPTLERTSWEIIHELKRRAPGTGVIGESRRFFETCDMVKFARHIPSDAENSAVISAAYRILEMVSSDAAADDPLNAVEVRGSGVASPFEPSPRVGTSGRDAVAAAVGYDESPVVENDRNEAERLGEKHG